jgi:Glycosyl hydrolases family 16
MERCGCRRCRRGHSRVLSVARSVSTGSTRTRSSGTQQNLRLYTPRYGFFEMRAKATDDPLSMVALWMTGYEDAPDRSAEICICETFGRDVGAEEAAVGIGVHPFGDPRIVDEFAAERLPVDAREFHSYAAVWTPDQVASFVDYEHLKDGSAVALLFDAANAQHLRVPRRAEHGPLPEAVRGRLRPRLSAPG